VKKFLCLPSGKETGLMAGAAAAAAAAAEAAAAYPGSMGLSAVRPARGLLLPASARIHVHTGSGSHCLFVGVCACVNASSCVRVLSAPPQVGEPVPLDAPFYQRLLSGECPDWEAADPPCGIATDGPLLARGQYRVGRGVLQVARLAGDVLQEAAGSGGRVGAHHGAGARAVSTAVAMLRAIRGPLSTKLALSGDAARYQGPSVNKAGLIRRCCALSGALCQQSWPY